MRFGILFTFILAIGLPHSDAFLSEFLNRIQDNWKSAWKRMRDDNLQPRVVADLPMPGSPTFVQTVDGIRGDVELAVNIHNGSDVVLMRIRHISDWLRHGINLKIEKVADNIGHPMAVGKVDGSTMPGVNSDLWWASSVFFPPQGEEGRIVFLYVNGSASIAPQEIVVGQDPIHITNPHKGKNWYYSSVTWKDMNNDGWPDIITSRSRGMPGAIKFSELVWFQHPGYNYILPNQRTSWHPHAITHGPDVSFKVIRIPYPNGESRMVIIGAGYWDNKLYAVWTEDPNEDWTNVDLIKERVIDNHGWFFDLQVADINADGRDDILVSTWSHRLKQGSVIVYEIPCDFSRDEWRRHILINGAVDIPLPHLGSGAKINAFHPVTRHGMVPFKEKPHIMVSGDDNGVVYTLVPKSPKTNNWEYKAHEIYGGHGSVGPLAIDDLNYDGFAEVIIPVLEENRLLILTYERDAMGPSYFPMLHDEN